MTTIRYEDIDGYGANSALRPDDNATVFIHHQKTYF